MKSGLLLPLFLGLCTAVPAMLSKRQTACTNPTVRKEWRSLTSTEKSDYLEAVQCLQTIPSRLTTANNLWDDFASIHRTLDTQIHLVAAFLPWHRYFLVVYESALRDDCSYTGPLTYWDWSLDSDSPFTSPVFSATSGFGGNGTESTNCVVDGPFANTTLHIPNTHCLARNFNTDMFGSSVTPAIVNDTLAINGYTLFRPGIEEGVHRGAHGGIMGDMLQNYSPNDPLFFLHHGNIDRLWWLWQGASVARRTEYSGNRVQGNASQEATLQDVAPMAGLAEDLVVSEIMWTESGPFCYTYDG